MPEYLGRQLQTTTIVVLCSVLSVLDQPGKLAPASPTAPERPFEGPRYALQVLACPDVSVLTSLAGGTQSKHGVHAR